MRKTRLSVSATSVASTSGDVTSGCAQAGALVNAAGWTDTATNDMMPMPITSVRRPSSTRVEMICTPPIMMNTAVNSSADAITGRGMMVRMPIRVGCSAASTSSAATAKAMTRLATPVAATRPTLAVEMVRP